MHSVFTYGTLQLGSVMQAVTGKGFPSQSATLHGYQRFKIKGRTYPGIVKNESSAVQGTLFREIDAESLILLDEFEDICYERCLLDVMVNDKKESAFVYVTSENFKQYLSNEEWNLEEFERKYLKKYLERILSY